MKPRLKYLFDSWGSLKKRLSQARHILLCADFDGTITAVKPRPKEANLGADIRLLLRKISQTEPFIVGIISGRALKDIQEKVGVKGLIYAGNHGLEIAYKKKNFIYPAAKAFIPVISRIGQKLTRELTPFPQAVLEEKGLSLSLHYRLVKKDKLLRLKKVFFQIIRPYITRQKINPLRKKLSKGVRLTFGKKVWEVRPALEWDKGRTVLWLVQRLRYRGTVAIYLGDDLTDEDAFRAVNKIRGISILVGRRRNSLARYYLKSTKDTQKFLEEISQIKIKK